MLEAETVTVSVNNGDAVTMSGKDFKRLPDEIRANGRRDARRQEAARPVPRPLLFEDRAKIAIPFSISVPDEKD